MKAGYLSQYFTAVAAKRLSQVEADTSRSNQHEFNGTNKLKSVLGTGNGGEKVQFPAIFIWLGKENEAVSADGFVTWYDARRNHPSRSEYRLYFPTTDVSEKATAGDTMYIARRTTDNSIMIIIASAGSTIENQLSWLFGITAQTQMGFTLNEIDDFSDKQVDFAVRFILEELGIEVEEPEADYLDSLLSEFKGVFPKTKEFSLLARKTLKNVDPFEEPDKTLMAWMDHEEKLFRRLERQIVENRIRNGFVTDGNTDVDGFINFSLSVHNRRKARAGFALEHHLEEIFRCHNIIYSRLAETENKSKPDFLFPGAKEYHDQSFSADMLTMLGVKTSCKDRWRQVLSEAARIQNKHLFTLEPGISENQTNEMQSHRLQLVIPASIHETYKTTQRAWLMSLKDFIQVLVQ
jgi:hypothetical protein